MRKKLMLLAAVAASAIGMAFAAPSSAVPNPLACVVAPGQSNCNTNWGYNSVYNVWNNNGGNSVIWCFSLHTDGSNAGEYGTVQPGHLRSFWAGGYNYMHCQYYSGNAPIGVTISWG